VRKYTHVRDRVVALVAADLEGQPTPPTTHEPSRGVLGRPWPKRPSAAARSRSSARGPRTRWPTGTGLRPSETPTESPASRRRPAGTRRSGRRSSGSRPLFPADARTTALLVPDTERCTRPAPADQGACCDGRGRQGPSPATRLGGSSRFAPTRGRRTRRTRLCRSPGGSWMMPLPTVAATFGPQETTRAGLNTAAITSAGSRRERARGHPDCGDRVSRRPWKRWCS